MNSQKYQGTLEIAWPSLQELYPGGFVLQQDGATCHTSRSSREWFASNHWTVSDWPANSPDLNPIENVWGIMKKALEKKKTKNLNELERIIQDVWDEITLPYLVNLVGSMPHRITKCIDLSGELTG